MKKLLVLLATLFALTVNAELAKPVITSAERVFTNNDANQPAVILTWQQTGGAAAYQIQRKLFLFGWRNKATIRGDNIAWSDRQPSKRAATYRIRALNDSETSKWSNTVKVPAQ